MTVGARSKIRVEVLGQGVLCVTFTYEMGGRGGLRERERQKERERKTEREVMCVCVQDQ